MDPIDSSTRIENSIDQLSIKLGNLLVTIFHRAMLFGIALATVWSAFFTFLDIIQKRNATIEDLLLLFIYLELGAMVGIYFKTNHMPVRFLIYVAITAVTRLIIDLVNTKHEADVTILMMGLTILILAMSNALVRYASFKFPSRVDSPQAKTLIPGDGQGE
jgi:protein PsiE